MSRKLSLRAWATPLTIGSFLLMAATGILMFFELEPGLTTVVHQWFSWLFLLGAVAHIAINIRPFKNHLKSHWGRASIAAFTVILALSLTSWGLITGPALKRPIERALVDAPISALAGVARTDINVLLGQLQAQGITSTGAQSLQDLVEQYGIDENILLGMIFLPE